MTIIDMHTHLWGGDYQNCKTAILNAMEKYGYSKSYVSGLQSVYPDSNEISELNSEVYKFTLEHSDMIGGYCYLNPNNSNTMYELQKCIEQYGFAGVKLWIATFCDDESVNPIAEYCALHGKPILIHALDKTVGSFPCESKGVNVRNLAIRFPDTKIIMAHFGGNEYTGIKAIADCPNVFVDICGVLYRCDTIDYTVKRIGAGRLLYGTDIASDLPHWYIIARVNAADLTAEEKEYVFYKNAQKLGL